MEQQPRPDRIVYGSRAAMLAEVGVPEYYEGAFLVLPMGDAQWDAEGHATLADARADAQHLAAVYGGIPVDRV